MKRIPDAERSSLVDDRDRTPLERADGLVRRSYLSWLSSLTTIIAWRSLGPWCAWGLMMLWLVVMVASWLYRLGIKRGFSG